MTDPTETRRASWPTIVSAIALAVWGLGYAVAGVWVIVVAVFGDWARGGAVLFLTLFGIGVVILAVWLFQLALSVFRLDFGRREVAFLTVAGLTALTGFGALFSLLEVGFPNTFVGLAELAVHVAVLFLLSSQATRQDFAVVLVEHELRPPEETKARLAAVPAEPGADKPDPILVADGVTKSFGGLQAVDVEHLEIERGAITALIGPNGAGKTTLFNVLTGFGEPDTGEWSFEGHELSRYRPHVFARVGMVRTFQLTKVLAKLTVLENMKLAAAAQTGENFFRALVPPVWGSQERDIERRAEDLLDRFRMTHMKEEFAGTLSGGQRKLLEMARALMTQPRMIMLDEPMAGVNPALTQSLLEHIKDIRAEGVTVLFIEHDMDVVSSISDWVVVMAEGKIIAESPPDQVGANKQVIDAYLGAHHDAPLTLEEEEKVLEETEAAIEAGSE